MGWDIFNPSQPNLPEYTHTHFIMLQNSISHPHLLKSFLSSLSLSLSFYFYFFIFTFLFPNELQLLSLRFCYYSYSMYTSNFRLWVVCLFNFQCYKIPIILIKNNIVFVTIFYKKSIFPFLFYLRNIKKFQFNWNNFI